MLISLVIRAVEFLARQASGSDVSCGQIVSETNSTQPVKNWKEPERMVNVRKILVAATFEKAKT